ncbi:hypothetical protein FF011L_12350 [Roseimaritima multifibrata]|uniref:Uncharacterized protein n=1 Tax=Roseimaritima multifibrata TaxID=1930274 RepID=A0A517MC82_9BACT|nr:hypothetical protein [Roseimaritima multifibrata]QDS92492.1 hypothetical protein FF011L_12350 [Roseimaritima multifibrata]
MYRTAVFTLLTMLVGIPSILVADEPEQGQVATPAFDVTSLHRNIPSIAASRVSVAVSDVSLPTFVAGIELLLERDKELARELVAAVDRDNRPHQSTGIPTAEHRVLVTLESSISNTEFEQIVRFALADDARLARALIGVKTGNR